MSVMNIENGGKVWRTPAGKIHRTDGPAVEDAYGDKKWYWNNLLHRTDGPAKECADGNKSWWVNGELHRTDGPAVVFLKGVQKWYLRDVLFSKTGVESYVCQLNLKVLMLSRAVNPFCEINVTKYLLVKSML